MTTETSSKKGEESSDSESFSDFLANVVERKKKELNSRSDKKS